VISLPGLAAHEAGPASLVAWLVLVLLSIPLATTFAALGARHPDGGGVATYARRESNLALSRRRAEAVSAFLTNELNVPAFRISSVGYGETQPIANNDTEQGRTRNRRIDVIIEPQLESAPP
jgi:amino acid transporter